MPWKRRNQNLVYVADVGRTLMLVLVLLAIVALFAF
jgi:hypothetical protein